MQKKTFDKNLYLFLIKTLNKLEIGENIFNLVKGIYKNSAAHIIYLMGKDRMFSPQVQGQENDVHYNHFY